MVSNSSTLMSDAKSLSQVIGNLQGATQRLNVATALPPEVRQTRNSVVDRLMSEINRILAYQLAVKAFVHESLPKLQRAQTDLKSQTNTALVTESINEVRAQALDLGKTINALVADVRATLEEHEQFSERLGQLQYELKEQNDNERVDQATQARLKESVDSMIADCSDMRKSITYVINSLSLTNSDNDDIIRTLQGVQGERIVAELYLTTAIQDLQRLQTDAA